MKSKTKITNIYSDNIKYIDLAIDLAKKANPAPNPKVGCIIVKNNKIIGKGYHKTCGKEHAEIIALKKAGKKAKNATMYVSLEPCSTYGKTPPCTDLIIKAGIKKIVIGCRDINTKNNKGAKILRNNDINVQILNYKKAININKFYNKFITEKKPYIAIKSAVSLDGKIALNNGKSKWITNSKSREKVQQLRNEYQAVMTGVSTVLKDDPRLTCRLKNGKNPIKIIIDSTLKIPLDAKLFKEGQVIIATTKNANKKKINFLKNKKIDIIISKDKNKQVDLNDLIKKLIKKEISNILVEAGPNLVTNLIKNNLADKFYFFIGSKILGSNMSAISDLNFNSMEEIIKLKDINIEIFDKDVMIEGEI